jgi:hypothetical protein
VQPELWKSANFAKASSIPGLNPNQAEYFKKTYYLHSKLCELQQEEGQLMRANPMGICSFLTKKKT